MADDDSIDLSDELDLGNSSFEDSAPLDMDAEGMQPDGDSVSGIDSVEEEVENAPAEQVDEAAGDEAAGDEAADDAFVAPKGKGILSTFSIFDAMLVCSLLLVTMAALMMASGLSEYGGFFGLPWKLSGITVK